MRPKAPMTRALLIAIAMVFLAEVLSGISPFYIEQDDLGILAGMGAIIHGTLSRGEYWRLIAAMFLHIGALHLLLNMWALYQLGSIFEALFGPIRFLMVYVVSGIAASVVSASLSKPGLVSAGASGAIFGILGALIFAIRRSPVWKHQPWSKGLTRQLMMWAAINVVIGFSIPGIDNGAHLGGFAAGLLLGFIPHRVPPPPPNSVIIDARPSEGVSETRT